MEEYGRERGVSQECGLCCAERSFVWLGIEPGRDEIDNPNPLVCANGSLFLSLVNGASNPHQVIAANAMSSPIAVTSRSFRLGWSFDEATVRTLSMWAAWGRRRDAFASHTQNFHRNNRCSGCASAFRNTLSL
jgi:hypothetical protein